MSPPRRILLLGCVSLSTAVPVLAHHSFAMFDSNAQVTLTGVVKDFQWTNPHVWIQLDVTGADGKVVDYSIEANSPNGLGRRGWKRTIMKPGDKVSIIVNPLRDGGAGGSLVEATLEDGTKLQK